MAAGKTKDAMKLRDKENEEAEEGEEEGARGGGGGGDNAPIVHLIATSRGERGREEEGVPLVAVAAGCCVRVVGREEALHPAPRGAVRAICMCDVVYKEEEEEEEEKDAEEGKTRVRALLATGGDDKCVTVWDAGGSWSMLAQLSVEKKVCAIAFSRNGAYVLAADKYGSVLVAPTAPIIRGEKVSFVPLLGHFCTIVTALSFSRDGRFLCSGGRDERVRVTRFPPCASSASPMDGAHEIQALCIGHSSFVSSIAVVENETADADADADTSTPSSSSSQTRLVVSAGGDGTLKLWNLMTGTLLDSLNVADAFIRSSPQDETDVKGKVGNERATSSGPAAPLAAAPADTTRETDVATAPSSAAPTAISATTTESAPAAIVSLALKGRNGVAALQKSRSLVAFSITSNGDGDGGTPALRHDALIALPASVHTSSTVLLSYSAGTETLWAISSSGSQRAEGNDDNNKSDMVRGGDAGASAPTVLFGRTDPGAAGFGTLRFEQLPDSCAHLCGHDDTGAFGGGGGGDTGTNGGGGDDHFAELRIMKRRRKTALDEEYRRVKTQPPATS